MDIDKLEVEKISKTCFHRAQKAWAEHGGNFTRIFADSIEKSATEHFSVIPGYELLLPNQVVMGNFVALSIDMRDSTGRLKQENNIYAVNGFERLYYETSTLLPALAYVVEQHNGTVTEYLGDGILALFNVNDFNNKHEALRHSYLAANSSIQDVLPIVNKFLQDKFHSLPDIRIGCGISISEAMVYYNGSRETLQAKASGICVWEASKLNFGNNMIFVSAEAQSQWPSSTTGGLSFITREIDDMVYYEAR